MMNNWQEIKGSLKRVLQSSRVKTEEALQITQINHRLRSLRNERDESVQKLGEEAYRFWQENRLLHTELQRLCDRILAREELIAMTEKEKEEIRETYARKLRDVYSPNSH